MARWLMFVLLLVAVPAGARTEVPDTPAGRALSAWLLAFNQADRDALAAFDRVYGQREPLEDTLSYRDYTGGFTLLAIQDEGPKALVATLRERDAGMADVTLTLRLADGDPATLAALDFQTKPIVRLGQAEAVDGLRRRAAALADDDQFSGAYLVARHGEVLAEHAHGMADRAAATANTLDTRFRFGSAGKMFTAVAVLQLVEAGELSLDATVDTYLPGYPNRDVATRVTLRHLLTHTGGTGGLDNLERDYAGDRSALRSHGDYLEAHGTRGLAFEPGTKVDYSNYGFVLLGAIIENVTGQDYYEVLDKKVFAPAGMASTGAEPESASVPGRAVAYRRQGDAWVDAAATLPWRGTAAGGGYTTVGDLLKFAQALQAGKLLSPAMLAQATSPQMQENWYGFGFITVGEGGLRRYGHGGDADGMNADFRVFPESGWVLVSLSNFDPPSAYRLMRWFEPRMPVARGD
jgi:CubicO group peptidase (beta-lactamase class C family)